MAMQVCSINMALQYYLSPLAAENGGEDSCLEAYECGGPNWKQDIEEVSGSV